MNWLLDLLRKKRKEDPIQDMVMEMHLVCSYLEKAKEYGLETEAVAYALAEMKADPSLSISEAMYHGTMEWIK